MQGVGLVLMVLSLGWATGDGGPLPEPLEEMVSDQLSDELQHQHNREEEKEAKVTSMWAIHVLGGIAVADQIASDLNAVNIGQVRHSLVHTYIPFLKMLLFKLTIKLRHSHNMSTTAASAHDGA